MSHESACTRIPFTYSICPRHPEYDGKSSSGRLLICSMGVSPSPLLCGPTANYGSIIITCTVIANPEAIRAFSYKFYRSSFRSHGAPTIRLRIMCLMNGYSIFNFCERIFMSPHYSDKKGSKCKVFRKSFFKYFFEIFFCSFNLLCNCRS